MKTSINSPLGSRFNCKEVDMEVCCDIIESLCASPSHVEARRDHDGTVRVFLYGMEMSTCPFCTEMLPLVTEKEGEDGDTVQTGVCWGSQSHSCEG